VMIQFPTLPLSVACRKPTNSHWHGTPFIVHQVVAAQETTHHTQAHPSPSFTSSWFTWFAVPQRQSDQFVCSFRLESNNTAIAAAFHTCRSSWVTVQLVAASNTSVLGYGSFICTTGTGSMTSMFGIENSLVQLSAGTPHNKDFGVQCRQRPLGQLNNE
jgi:hypothetical protein